MVAHKKTNRRKKNKNFGWPSGQQLISQLSVLGSDIRKQQLRTAEGRIDELQWKADELLAMVENEDVGTVKILRDEARRLYSNCFEITRELLHGNLQAAYKLSRNSEAGESWGLTG